MLTELLIVLIFALVNGFFALSEMAVLTARKSRLRQLAQDSRRAMTALKLTEVPERFLSTVQVFITLITSVMGAYSGAKIGETIAHWLDEQQISYFAPYTLAIGMSISVSGVVFINMLVGELLPKRIALLNPERIAVSVAIPLQIMTWIALPFAFTLTWITKNLLHLVKMDKVSGNEVSEEEIRLLVAEGVEQGVIDADERNMVNRVLRLGDRRVSSLMTPRTRIAWLNISAPLQENFAVMRHTPFSRYPVYRDNEQEIVGILKVKSLIDIFERKEVDLFHKLAKPLFVPNTARAMDLLEDFREAESRLALVVDEYGEIEGLVTLNDLLSAVVGTPATSSILTRDAPIVQRADGSYLVDGAVGSDDLRELLALTHLPHEKDHEYHTAAGMMMARFGRIPHIGEKFAWRGFIFEVLDLDGPRIDKILIVPEDNN